ncbi:MAG: FixH family protein [Bacteroides sp.]|nr:FixH family protein [Bacteroides sp.]
MKFHWGTGILIFLILFLLAAGFFIAFAMRQEVSLVHENYYERGVDHSDQIKVQERSAPYADALYTRQDESSLYVGVQEELAAGMDSSFLLLYRPSDQNLDLDFPFDPTRGELVIPMEELKAGRYILKLSWSSGGLKYETENTVVIN